MVKEVAAPNPAKGRKLTALADFTPGKDRRRSVACLKNAMRLMVFRVLAIRQDDAHRQQMVRIKTGVNRLQTHEALDQKSRAH